MKRADHYAAADDLVWKVRRQLSSDGGSYTYEDLTLMVQAAQVHATLAAAGPGVEQEVADQEKRAARAVAGAEDAACGCAGASTTCRCTGLPHALGSPGCEQRGVHVRVEETAGTVRPSPLTNCRCPEFQGVSTTAGTHLRGERTCRWYQAPKGVQQ